ncbi:SgcJ/EcaC family oxidoreductase [Hymenobacter rigui]|uniref:SgcJ/EcaC family oxidoreductase n=1 Tax=Hymenobacter rigui TaxID=334424 RepID=A0A428KKA2_9BACT|nr:SgcJ/EcaC family oxidoreductase [Hymenobacter rigui]RSK46866.1 SgcJ/EcaC family oxidoreductase [Hymenobacter rigui]
MKTLLLLPAALLLATAAPAQTLPAPDDQAVRAVVDHIVLNWNNHQYQDMATYTTPDVHWVSMVGMWWQGREAVQLGHQVIFDRMYQGVKFVPGPVTVRAITPEVAIANLTCHVGAFYPPDGVNRGTNKMGDDENILTLVLVKQQGRWLLTAAQNTVVDASAAKHNPVKVAAR